MSDEFNDSLLPIKGAGSGSPELVDTLHEVVHGDFRPDLTLILDVPVIWAWVAAYLRRKHSEDRYEQMDIAFHERLRFGFFDIAKKEPSRYVVVDTSRDEASVFKEVIDAVNNRLGLTLGRRLYSDERG